MTRPILTACVFIASLHSLNAHAQSTVNISGSLQVAAAKGNGGSTPIDGATSNKWALNDQSSVIDFSGKEDLGGGLYAGFQLRTFIAVDTGTASTPFWSSRSVVKLGGAWGELYAGRSLTPAAFMVLFADPWYWDGSAAQVGWQIQQANYTSTAYLRTDNTVGYNSPTVGGFSVNLAASAGEGAKGQDVSGAANYKQGPLWLGVGFDRSKGFDGKGANDRLLVLAGAYDFGVARPLFSYARSKVNGASYSSASIALTAPVGEVGLLRGAVSRLSDWNTATVAEESLTKVSLGYQYNLSKRTNVFVNLSSAKGQTASATRTTELGLGHSF